MRTKVTLVLLFLNVALFFFIFKFERQWRTDGAAMEARRRVLGPETANIQSIEIATKGAPTVRLAKTAEGWQLAAPSDWPANPHAVSRIISELQLLEHVTSFNVAELGKTDQSLADYGLDDPKLTVTFSSADPAELKSGNATAVTLRIGRETPDGNRLYVLSPDGQRIHVVPRSLAGSLTQPVEQLRSDAVFTIQVFEVRSLVVQSAPPANLRVRVQRTGNRWTFEAPIQARASELAAKGVIGELNNLRVKSFVAPSPTDAAPNASPELRITLEGNDRSERLLIGTRVAAASTPSGSANPTEVEYHAMMEGKAAVFTVVISDDLMRTLRNAQVELREKRLLDDFDPQLVTAITLSAPNSPASPQLTLQRDSGSAAWQLVLRDADEGTKTQPVDPDAIQRLLAQLSQLSAENFLDVVTAVDRENWGFNRPERIVTLTLAPQATTAAARPGGSAATSQIVLKIGVGSERGERAYAMIGDNAPVYEVNAEILRETPVTPLAYRDRVLQELPAGARITAVKLTDLFTQAVLLDETLSAAAPKPELQPLLAELRHLRARSFVSDHYEAEDPDLPWRYRLEATISLVGGTTGAQTETLTLQFSERTGGTTQLAGSAQFNTTWQIEPALMDALWAITYKRDPGPPAPSR